MASEKEKMLGGLPYNAADAELVAERKAARKLLFLFNNFDPDNEGEERWILERLLPNAGANINITPPFYCDYGYNVRTGENFYANYGCTLLDVTPITIGRDVKLGPSVKIFTATHPLDAGERASGIESGKPVTIGDRVWLGGGAIICPGVTIGADSVIGAGSIVTRDIPAGVLAAGNPARVIRQL